MLCNCCGTVISCVPKVFFFNLPIKLGEFIKNHIINTHLDLYRLSWQGSQFISYLSMLNLIFSSSFRKLLVQKWTCRQGWGVLHSGKLRLRWSSDSGEVLMEDAKKNVIPVTKVGFLMENLQKDHRGPSYYHLLCIFHKLGCISHRKNTQGCSWKCVLRRGCRKLNFCRHLSENFKVSC